jgi:hypothetical protein
MLPVWVRPSYKKTGCVRRAMHRFALIIAYFQRKQEAFLRLTSLDRQSGGLRKIYDRAMLN